MRKVVPPSFGLLRLPRLLLAYELLHLLHHFSSLDLLLLLWVTRVSPTHVWKLSAPPLSDALCVPPCTAIRRWPAHRRSVRESLAWRTVCPAHAEDQKRSAAQTHIQSVRVHLSPLPATATRHRHPPPPPPPPARDRHLTLHERKPIPHIRIAHRSHRCSYSVCTAPSSQPGQVVQSAFQCASRPRPRREGGK